MKKLTIAFDVDDTIIIPSVVTGFPTDTPNYESIAVYRWFEAQGHDMVVWSGGGVSYAEMWAQKLGLGGRVIAKGSERVDIAFDDCDVELGAVNVKVSRIKNNISRKDWNEHRKI